MNFFRSKKSSPLKIAIILFVALALFILIVEKPGSRSAQKQEEAEPLLFPRLQWEEVTNLVIRQPAAPLSGGSRYGGNQPEIKLRKTDEGWRVGEAAADARRIEDFIVAIQTLRSTSLVSRNPGKQSLFGVDPENAVRIQVWRNTKNLADFYVGKSAGLGTAYLRREGSDEVVQAAPLLPEFKFAP